MDIAIQTLKSHFQTLIQQRRLSHAHLIECPLTKPIDDVVRGFVPQLLCSSMLDCGQCQSCLLLKQNAHPDLIQLPNEQQTVKVADIRDLSSFIYQAPNLANYRVIVIGAVDKLNQSAANALLKMLEEPPKHVVFILTCQNVSQVLATVRSRTVQWKIPVSIINQDDLAHLSTWLNQDEGKMQLLDAKSRLIDEMNAVYELKEHPCDIAQNWQQYPIQDLLWVLYILHGVSLRSNYSNDIQKGYFGNNTMMLQQVQQIHAMIKLINKGIALNHILMCETLLMGCRGIAK
ncbi:hypothetical protein [Legionella sp. W05-934-2]|jgi:DNA polymerase-3 subunit delta'|uniref:hypothetical protein n=1 Tax=Legionella sp. W05-934-2 TaxID=1198649 RepID=UPI003462CF9E